MAKKNGQTVTIKVDLTDEIIDKLGSAIANVLSKTEATQCEAEACEKDKNESAPVAEVAQAPAPVVEATEATPQTAATVVPNYPQQPVTPPVAPQYPQTPAPQAPYSPQATPVPMQNTQPATTGTAPVASYPVSEAGPAQSAYNGMSSATTPTALEQPTASVAPQTVELTLDVISKAGAELADKGMFGAALDILHKYGVDAVTMLKPENYAAVAAEFRALGANI